MRGRRTRDVRLSGSPGSAVAAALGVRDDVVDGVDAGSGGSVAPEARRGAGSTRLRDAVAKRGRGRGVVVLGLAVGLAALLLLGAGVARADEPRDGGAATRAEGALTGGEKPWQRGVTAEARAAAEREFLAGNALFERSEYAAAAARYRVALGSWAHPAIQFNLAVCLIHLDRPVEAYDTVQAALRFGREALPERFDEAHTYERLLRDRIATLEVTLPAEMVGAVVTLDGEPLVGAGGERVTRRLAPGRHALVARKERFETWSKDLVLPPGEVTREVIALRAPRTRTVRRWPAARPWWVMGAGGATAALGAASLLLGNANLRAVTAEVTQQCPPPDGCRDGLPSGLAGERDRAVLQQRVGATLLVGGAAVVATGVVLLVLNQPREVLDTPAVTVRISPEEIGLGWAHAF